MICILHIAGKLLHHDDHHWKALQEEKSPVIARKSLCGTDGNPHLDNSGQSYKILETILQNSGQQMMEGCCLIVALSINVITP